MIAFVRDEIGRVCDRFTQETGVLVTPTTRDLAAEIISAVAEDPHPRWRVEVPQLQEFLFTYVQQSPKFLRDIQNQQKIEKRITAFDLLHWMTQGKALESWLCIIPKSS